MKIGYNRNFWNELDLTQQYNTSDYTQWACLRPMAPDMMPIIKQSKVDSRVFYHTGHGHLGWTLSPATAKKLTNAVLNAHF